jgi:hypothetical protein
MARNAGHLVTCPLLLISTCTQPWQSRGVSLNLSTFLKKLFLDSKDFFERVFVLMKGNFQTGEAQNSSMTPPLIPGLNENVVLNSIENESTSS